MHAWKGFAVRIKFFLVVNACYIVSYVCQVKKVEIIGVDEQQYIDEYTEAQRIGIGIGVGLAAVVLILLIYYCVVSKNPVAQLCVSRALLKLRLYLNCLLSGSIVAKKFGRLR